MLKLLHYCIGDPAHLPSFPSGWGAPPSLTEEQRRHVPPGLASVLYSDVGSKFYERCTIGEDLPGWVMNEAATQEVVWQVQPAKDESKEWDWLYLSDVQEGSNLAAELRERSRQTISDTSVPETICVNDPTTPMLLSSIQTRCLDARPSDWVYKREEEPVGVRIGDAVVLFTWSSGMIGPRLLVTHISRLQPGQLPEALEAMDVVAHKAGRKEGWAWGLNAASPLMDKWKTLESRQTSTGRRAEIDGHLLCVAWYGDAEERGAYGDTDMWTWC